MEDFTNKVVVITGASSGIGAATAVLFANKGAKLVLVGRNKENLEKTAKQCETAKGIKPLLVQAEMQKDEDVESIVTKAIETFGHIDVLVNNAAVGIKGSILEGVKLYDTAMNTNMRSVYLLTSLAAPYLIKSKGCIVNVSSVGSLKPIRDVNFLPYCISKAALDQFTRCVALELARSGVRVNSVNPGATKTPFAENAGFSKEQAVEIFKKRDMTFPLGKTAQSEEVADLILYLASDRARSITGSIYVIDNGEMLL